MADDLEAFLRQAAQRRAQKRPTASQPPKPAPPKQAQRSVAARRSPPAAVDPRAIVQPELVDEPLSDLSSHLDSSSFQQRAEHFAEEVGQADEHMEAHLHDKFDHKVGRLAVHGVPSYPHRTSTVQDESLSVASLIQMLRDPNTVVQAVVLSEILAPPQNRWSE